MITIIDYGMGNLRSVRNAFEALGAETRIASVPDDLDGARGIVLPGVGAFADGIRNLRSAGFADALDDQVRHRGKPFLGLCLGMQLLATRGFEHGEETGLGWIDGIVDRIVPPADAGLLRIPHMGWNEVSFSKGDGLYAGMGVRQTFYFVHSYVVRPTDPSVVSGYCSYGSDFAASLETGNVFATQYHPEKSHTAGLAVLKNFLARVG